MQNFEAQIKNECLSFIAAQNMKHEYFSWHACVIVRSVFLFLFDSLVYVKP